MAVLAYYIPYYFLCVVVLAAILDCLPHGVAGKETVLPAVRAGSGVLVADLTSGLALVTQATALPALLRKLAATVERNTWNNL